MILSFHSINMCITFIDLCYVETSLHPRNKSHLIMGNNPFNMMLNSIFQNFIESFCIYIHQGYWPVVFFSSSVLFWFWYHNNAALVKCLEVFPPLRFVGSLRRLVLILL